MQVHETKLKKVKKDGEWWGLGGGETISLVRMMRECLLKGKFYGKS